MLKDSSEAFKNSSRIAGKVKKGMTPPVVAALAVGVLLIIGVAAAWQKTVGEKSTRLANAEAERTALNKKVKELSGELSAKEKEAADAKKTAEEKAKEAEAARLAALEVPLDWRVFTVTPFGFEFRYPKEWGEAALKTFKLEDKSGERGEGGNITFSALRPTVVLAGWNSADYTSSKPSLAFDAVRFKGIKNCDDLKNRHTVSNCEEIKTRDGLTALLYRESQLPADQVNGVSFSFDVGAVFTGNERFPVFAVQINQDANIAFDSLKRVIASIKNIAAPPVAATSSPPAAAQKQ
ncbi:hypothetical protein EPN90_03610 [Patescibacteria group bacterium]|nr:MAG: hypothetical protein EPN90_03610 [Patescibacteria group bacterium]